MAKTTTEERHIKIIMDGKQVSASLKDMEKAQNLMNAELKKMSATDPRRKELLKEFSDMRERVKKVKDEMYGVQKASAATKTGFGGVTSATNMMGAGFKSAMAALMPLFAIQKVFAFLDDSKEKFNTQAQAVAQLDATLKSTGNSAGFTSKELQDMASQLQGKTLFGDEATIQAQSLLLTFTDIKKGVFEDAMPAIQDMAQKMAGDGPADLKGATIQVGKALNDPIKGISALSKVGVSFTEEQKATIKTLSDMGDKAGAQKLILAELNKEFGGSAEAARNAGKGGWTAFMNTVGDVQELIGEKLTAGLNTAANFFGLVIEKSDPLVAVFRELWNIGAELYDELYNIVSSLEIFNSEGDGAGTVVKILTGAFTALLYPVKIALQVFSSLVTGFINLYNRSELLRGTIGGLGAAIYQVFLNIKENALNVLGGVGDLLVGIFTLDTDKIKSGLKKTFEGVSQQATNLGKGVGAAFMAGYADNKNDQIIRKTKQDAEEIGATTLKAVEENGKRVQELTAKQQKEKEKKEEENKRKLEKAREDYKKASEKEELELAKLKIEIMQDGVDKVLAKLRFQHDQEKKEMENQKAAILANVAATEEEKQKLLDQYKEQQKIKDEQLLLAEHEAKEAAQEKDKNDFWEQLEEEEEYQGAALEEQFLRTLDAEGAREQALLELKKQTLDQKLTYLQQAGRGETLEAIKLKNEILRIEKEKTDKTKALAEERTKFETMMGEMRLQIAGETLDGIIGYLNEESGAFQAFKAIRKVLSMAEVFLNLEKEKAFNAVTAAANPLNAVTGGAAGVAQLKVMNTLSMIRSGFSLAKIAAFEKGGDTVPMIEVAGRWQMANGHTGGSIGAFADGGVVNNARLGLIGERGAEWVMPNWMMRSPKYADTYRWLESERQRKGVTAFVEGGPTAMPAGVAQPATPQELQQMLEQMQALNSNFVSMARNVEQWQRGLHVSYSAGAAEEVMSLRSTIQQGSEW